MKKLSLYITLALVSLFLGACSDEYQPWSEPQANQQEDAITFPGLKALEVAPQDLATVGEQVPLFTLTSAQLPEGFELQNARVELLAYDLNNDGITPTTIQTSVDGKAITKDMQAIAEKYYGKRPEAHRYTAHVYLNAVKGGQAVLIDAGNIMLTVTPAAPFIDEAYYIVGDMSSWDKAGAIQFKHSAEDVYKDPVFTVFIETKKTNSHWKIITKTNYDGDFWVNGKTGVLGTAVDGDASMEGTLTTNNPQAGKLAEIGKHRITINMLNYTYKIEKINFGEFLYMAGDANSWGHSDILAGPAFDGKYTGFMYLTQKGFKFSTEQGWNGTNYGENFSTEGNAGNIMMTEADGFYKVEVDLQALAYKLTAINSIGIVGSAAPGGWDTDVKMEYDMASHTWTAQHVALKDGEIKFRANGAWAISWGGTDLTKLTSQNGANIAVKAGTYTIKLKPSYDGNTVATLIAE